MEVGWPPCQPAMSVVASQPVKCDLRQLDTHSGLDSLELAHYRRADPLRESPGRQVGLAPKEQPPRKLSGTKDRKESRLWRVAAATQLTEGGKPQAETPW